MIPIKLILQAFGPFTTEQVIDFTALQNDRLFLITGNTGSGKTSIFDAITFALYGQPSGSIRSVDGFKSHFSDPSMTCFVRFTFAIGVKQFTIYREPPQLKLKRGGNISDSKPIAELTLDDGTIISGITTVNEQLESIVGIDCEQFRKLCMLPQGEFRRFLSEKTSAKQQTLRQIFKTDLLDRFTKQLYEHVNGYKRKLADIDAIINNQIGSIVCDDKELFHSCSKESVVPLLKQYNELKLTQLTVAQNDVSLVRKQMDEINLPYYTEINKNFSELELEKCRLKGLQSGEGYIIELTAKANLLRSIQPLNASHSTINDLTAQVSILSEKVNNFTNNRLTLQQQLTVITPQYDAAKESVGTIVDITRNIEQLKSLRNTILDIAELTAQIQRSNGLLATYRHQISQLDEYKAHLELQVYTDNLRHYNDSLVEYNRCAEGYKSVFDGFLSCQAAILGGSLCDDTPCPVCGSLSHPSPAISDAKVTSEELDVAKQQFEIITALVEQMRSKLPSPLPSDIKSSIMRNDTLLQSTSFSFAYSCTETEQKIHELENRVTKLSQSVLDASNRLDELNMRLGDCNDDAESITLSIKEQETKLRVIQTEYDRLSALYSHLNDDITRNDEALANTKSYLESQQTTLSQNRSSFLEQLEKLDISFDTFTSLCGELEKLDDYQMRINRFHNDLSSVTAIIESLSQRLQDKSPVNLEALQDEYNSLQTTWDEKNTAIAAISPALTMNQAVLSSIQKQLNLHNELSELHDRYFSLYSVANGSRSNNISFESFVLGYYFDKVILNANIRLEQMTNKRYTIVIRQEKEKYGAHSGLELNIHDANTGMQRDVITLSGGESFIVALALSLGLADITAEHSGGIEINTLFIDEGFGSLDSNSIDSAIECLTSLKLQGRYIGVISHVAELKDKISAKISVRQLPTGSVISM